MLLDLMPMLGKGNHGVPTGENSGDKGLQD